MKNLEIILAIYEGNEAREDKLIRRIPSKSFVSNFLAILTRHIKPDGTVYVKDQTGANRAVSKHQSNFSGQVGAGVDTAGTQVGTGTTAPTPGDYNLVAKIPHGNASGQLDYAAQTTSDYSVSGNDTIMSTTRTFTNNSGANITVNEVGLVLAAISGASTYWVLCIRDVLTVPEVISAGQAKTVQYQIKTTT